MKFAIARWCAPVVMLMLAGPPAWAQDGSDLPLPTAAEAYGAEDPLAVAPKRIDPTDSRAVKMLEQILQYDPENVNARIQNADLMIAKGQRQRGLDEYAYALRLAGADTKKQHTVHWNYGWALYRGGEVRGAISQWMKAEALHGGATDLGPDHLCDRAVDGGREGAGTGFLQVRGAQQPASLGHQQRPGRIDPHLGQRTAPDHQGGLRRLARDPRHRALTRP
jgi:tetratricopeptide (TPR) repeat protein